MRLVDRVTRSDLWTQEDAERYDDESADIFASDVLEPAVDFLAGTRRPVEHS